MKPSRIVAVDHVHREASPSLVDALRWFYATMGTLDEMPSNASKLVFRSQRLELRFKLLEKPEVDEASLPIMIRVPSLTDAVELLKDRHYEFEWLTSIHFADRGILLTDPAGHRAEIKQEWADEVL